MEGLQRLIKSCEVIKEGDAGYKEALSAVIQAKKEFTEKMSLNHTNLEVFDAVVLYYLRLRGKISAEEYYRKLGYVLNPYRKIFHDLQDLGYKAINLVWDELGPEFAASFIPLLVEPGILTRFRRNNYFQGGYAD